jgi:hypothetical protein
MADEEQVARAEEPVEEGGFAEDEQNVLVDGDFSGMK